MRKNCLSKIIRKEISAIKKKKMSLAHA